MPSTRPRPLDLRSLLEHPALYDAVQHAAGVGRMKRLLAPHFAEFAGSSVLDVGAGTGLYADLLPSDVDYVGVDLDPEKLERLRRHHPGCETVVADATALPFEDASFDHGICIALAHHLDDDGLPRLVDELARVVRDDVLFLDPVWAPARLRGRALWAIDRGAHPRTAPALREALARRFEIELAREHRVHHHYLFCVMKRRDG